MEKYDYYEAVKEDVKEALKDTDERDYDTLYDELLINDSVTGNASGSYYCNSWNAEEAICHNLDLLKEALWELGYENDYLLENGAEAADVVVRCYLLSYCLGEVLEELEDEEDEEA